MLDIEILEPGAVDDAARIFHRDGFVVVRDAVVGEQLRAVRAAADRVIAEQVAAIPPESANRGFSRYSFGHQMHHREWASLVDLPAVLPVLERIWRSDAFRCCGGGGDYALPGAELQELHADIGDFLADPLGQLTTADLPTPFIVVNVPLIDFTAENGATRFVPGTQRSRARIPTPADEPAWMRGNQIRAPAGCALIRDVRCWHGGCPNRSRQIRPMVSVGYHAPWFHGPLGAMPVALRATLSPRAQTLCAELPEPAARPAPAQADRVRAAAPS